MWSPERKKAISAAMSHIEKQFGKGSIMQMDQKHRQRIPVISTGDIGIDAALGTGGFPKGRIIEIYGPESSGKTTLALHVVSELQKAGGVAAFIDAEHALDISYAHRLGVNTQELLISQPDFGEQALEITEVLVRSGAVELLVVDSVAALSPKAEIDGDMGDSHMGLQARLMSQALRKLAPICAKTNASIIFINQLRHKIGVMFGSPEVTTGGQALKFYASVRVDIRRISSIKQNDEVTGNRVRVKIVKNKMAPPFGQTEFDVNFGEGISKIGSLLDLSVEKGLLEKSGSWYSYGSTRIGQGRENAKAYLLANPDTCAGLEASLRKILFPPIAVDDHEEEQPAPADAMGGGNPAPSIPAKGAEQLPEKL